MDVSLEAHEFVTYYLGVKTARDEAEAASLARDVLCSLGESFNPEKWILLFYNPEARAKLIALLIWIYRDTDNLDWALLFTNLEDDLEKKCREYASKKTLDDLVGKPLSVVALSYRKIFTHVGREVAAKFTADLLTFTMSQRHLIHEINHLALVNT